MEIRQAAAELHEEKRKTQGSLKIFFGYASGAGKTYAMLDAARAAERAGRDTVLGVVNCRGRADTERLCQGMEQLPLRELGDKKEFFLDAALKRRPELIVVDELAHINAPGSRHERRCQDVQELLKAGIDVYTSLDLKNLESLSDLVSSVTGISCEERIPDSVFDNAEQLELVDAEPEEIIRRLSEGQSPRAEILAALREIALRRCADRVNLLTQGGRGYHTDEHILVCLSSAPSNAKIIRTAARMAGAFRGRFTALFVETPDFSAMSDSDRERLRSNIRLAAQLGAAIETVYGEDVPYQIAEFARLSGVTKIVIGRSSVKKRRLFGKTLLTERLIENAPNLDIHIIPDSGSLPGKSPRHKSPRFLPGPRDLVLSLLILIACTGIAMVFSRFGYTEANIITVYILGVLITSVVTTSNFCGILSSVISVLVFNFFFTVPRYTLLAYDKSYPVTFLVMFTAATITGSLASRLKEHAARSAIAAYRTKLLFDTNQLLQKAQSPEEIAQAASMQISKLLERDVVFYFAEKDGLSQGRVYSQGGERPAEYYLCPSERSAAEWVMRNNRHAGAWTDTLSDARCSYLAIRSGPRVYGVIGIQAGSEGPDSFQNSLLQSILGECALALESEKNAREKRETELMAENERLRANLLRAISHDLRTPLTSISGNASNLLANGEIFDESTKKQIYSDIYDDSMWLINLVENLLAVTRIEDGRMQLRLQSELMDEVVSEALRHVSRKSQEHKITVSSSDDIILARMDARLMVQVIINIVDNAVKYTPPGSEIRIHSEKQGDRVLLSISDNGEGIPEEQKKRVFEMFYTGQNKVADSRRSLGLGLALCKAIVKAHGGEISVCDNKPKGTVFNISLATGEVELHE